MKRRVHTVQLSQTQSSEHSQSLLSNMIEASRMLKGGALHRTHPSGLLPESTAKCRRPSPTASAELPEDAFLRVLAYFVVDEIFTLGMAHRAFHPSRSLVVDTG